MEGSSEAAQAAADIIFLAPGLSTIINETIKPDLIIFITLFTDLATVAVTYDNAHVEPRPVEWQLKKGLVISLILGILLLAAGTVSRPSMPFVWVLYAGIHIYWGYYSSRRGR